MTPSPLPRAHIVLDYLYIKITNSYCDRPSEVVRSVTYYHTSARHTHTPVSLNQTSKDSESYRKVATLILIPVPSSSFSNYDAFYLHATKIMNGVRPFEDNR